MPKRTDRQSVFDALRRILEQHARTLSVSADTPSRYCLDGKVGPATLAAWSGKARRDTIPVCWVEMKDSRVSYHLMGIAGQPAIVAAMSKALRARMQGTSCFNFQSYDEALFSELAEVTTRAIQGFRKAAFIAD